MNFNNALEPGMNLQEQQSSAFEIYGFQLVKAEEEGMSGITYKAIEHSSQLVVSLRVLKPESNSNETLIEALERHIHHIKDLKHINIQRVLSLQKGEAGCVLIQEYVEGVRLDRYLNQKGILDWQTVVRLIKHILSGLSHAHQAGFVHRNLSPDSILIARGNTAKICDIGLDRVLKDNDVISEETWNQSPAQRYAAPESITNEFATSNEASDVYSIGLIAYKMLTGVNPFEDANQEYFIQEKLSFQNLNPPHLLNSDVPEALSIIIKKATEQHSIHRFSSAQSMLEALDELSTVSKKPGVIYHHRAGSRRRKLFVSARMLFLTGSFFALLAAGFFFLQLENENPFEVLSTNRSSAITPGQANAAVQRNIEPASDSMALQIEVLPEPPAAQMMPHEQTPSPAQTVPQGQTAIQEQEAPVPTTLVEQSTPSPQTATASEKHTLFVRSKPTGASVSINGKKLGKTPFRLTNITSEHAQIQLSLNGYQVFKKQIYLDDDGTTESFFNLKPTNKQLILTVFPWGNVYLDGALVAERVTGTDTLKITSEIETLSVVHPAFGNWEKLLTRQTSDTLSFLVDFRERTSIQIIALDDTQQSITGDVIIDGRHTNQVTPLTIELPLGEHSIEVRAAGFEPIQLTTRIAPEDERSEPLKLQMKRKPDVD